MPSKLIIFAKIDFKLIWKALSKFIYYNELKIRGKPQIQNSQKNRTRLFRKRSSRRTRPKKVCHQKNTQSQRHRVQRGSDSQGSPRPSKLHIIKRGFSNQWLPLLVSVEYCHGVCSSKSQKDHGHYEEADQSPSQRHKIDRSADFQWSQTPTQKRYCSQRPQTPKYSHRQQEAHLPLRFRVF